MAAIKYGASNVILNEFQSFEMFFIFSALFFPIHNVVQCGGVSDAYHKISLKSIANGTEFFVVMETFFIPFGSNQFNSSSGNQPRKYTILVLWILFNYVHVDVDV